MKTSIKSALITGILGLVGTVSAAVIGLNLGKSSEQRSIQNEISEVMGDMVNVIGDNNEITINDIKELVMDYQKLKIQNESLSAQNIEYFGGLTEANSKLEELQTQTSNFPTLEYQDLLLSIDIEDIPINNHNAMVIIDGREYLSKEIFEKIITEGQSATIKDGTLFIGKVVADKDNLFNKVEVGKIACDTHDSFTDSYNNLRYNAICFYNYTGTISYDVNREYSQLQFVISIRDDADMNGEGTIIVKADEDVVYSTPESINRLTEPFSTGPIQISNCKLVTIEYSTSMNNDCIISDAIIFN